MLDFLHRNKNEDENKEVENIVKEQSDVDDIKELMVNLEYMNSYLAQLNMRASDLVKQLTILNALHILDTEYNNADSIMSIDEILQRKYALLGEIFIDYRAKQEEEQKRNE